MWLKTLVLGLLLAGVFSSCLKDLDTEPLNEQQITSANVFNDPDSYKQFLAKLYGALTLTGQRGEYGQPEISAPDEGTTSFLRLYWSMQEISTDECLSAWGDAGLTEFNGHDWSAQNGYVQLFYQRIFINIAYCNEYIREVSDRVGDLDGNLQSQVNHFLLEARYLRAYYYFIAMDYWGNVPFVTEEDATGAFLPEQISRTELFNYIESELLAIEPGMMDAGTNEYARVDKAAVWMLLAKMYLNAEVYLGAGNSHYNECVTYCENIINSGAYGLVDSYKELFLADNDIHSQEIIWPIAEDGISTRNYGGMTFVIHAQVGGTMDAGNDYGIASGGWSGNRFTDSFVEKFDDISGETDSRAMFYTDGQILEIDNPLVFTEGYLCSKFRNITSGGAIGSDATFVDTDFPLYRLSDVYLMYAEAVLRGGVGSLSEATNYINLIRERAYGDDSGNIQSGDLNLDFILDERARELYWECHRRTDLIRFNSFTGNNYIWNWKGNIKAGASTPDYAALFPIPSTDIAVNTNLVQNPGY